MSDSTVPRVEPAARPLSIMPAVVTQRIDVAPDLFILRVAADGWELPDFAPGQYVVLGLPSSAPRCPQSDPEEEPPEPDKMIRRAYSIASSSPGQVHTEKYW